MQKKITNKQNELLKKWLFSRFNKWKNIVKIRFILNKLQNLKWLELRAKNKIIFKTKFELYLHLKSQVYQIDSVMIKISIFVNTLKHFLDYITSFYIDKGKKYFNNTTHKFLVILCVALF